MRRVMGRYVGWLWILALVAGCGGAEFSSDALDGAADGTTPVIDAGVDDGPHDAARERDGDKDDATVGDDGGGGSSDASTDAGSIDAGKGDSGSIDATAPDGAGMDATAPDAGGLDATAPDSGADAAPTDSGGSTGSDAACAITCGSICCIVGDHCCSGAGGGASTPTCVPKNALCPL